MCVQINAIFGKLIEQILKKIILKSGHFIDKRERERIIKSSKTYNFVLNSDHINFNLN